MAATAAVHCTSGAESLGLSFVGNLHLWRMSKVLTPGECQHEMA